MLTHIDLKKGVRIILDGQPYEVLEMQLMKKAQRRLIVQTKIKNLVTDNVLSRNFHQGDTFDQAELETLEAKFIYSHRNKFVLAEIKNSSQRYELEETKIGPQAKFLKPNQLVKLIFFDQKVINIDLPIKIQLKVIEAPPGVKGDSARAGTKLVTLETGAKINAPLFINEGDLIEINTQTEEYVRRIQ